MRFGGSSRLGIFDVATDRGQRSRSVESNIIVSTLFAATLNVLIGAYLVLMSNRVYSGTARFWDRYNARVGLCIAGCSVAAVVFLFLAMALSDAGAV